MSEKMPDRRSLRTKRALRNALAELMADKELNRVTVQEIADKADINRVTFYKHYLDVYDLYEKTEQEVLVELGLLVLQFEAQPLEDFFAHLIGYIDDNRPVFRMIFSPNSSGQLREKFGKCLDGLFRQIEAEKRNGDTSDERLVYQTCYRSHGCLAVIGKWVLNGFPGSKENIVKIVTELDRNTERLIDPVSAAKR